MLPISGSYPLWKAPTPVIIQRRAKVARRARTVRTLDRVIALFVSDLAVIALAHATINLVRHSTDTSSLLPVFMLRVIPHGTFPLIQVLVGVIAGLAVAGNYGTGARRRHTRRILGGSFIGVLFVFWSHVWRDGSLSSVGGFLIAAAALGMALVVGRRIVDLLVKHRPAPPATSRALVIGSRDRADSLIVSEIVRRSSELEIIGFVSTERRSDDQALGELSDLVWVLQRHMIDTVILADHIEDEPLIEVLEVAHNTGCVILSGLPLYPLGGFIPEVVNRGRIPYVQIKRPHLGAVQLIIKRTFDMMAAGFLLLLLSPVLAAVSIAVKVSSPGPVFFRQKRVGYGGRLFGMFKFRSMVKDAEGLRKALAQQSIYTDDRLFKVKNDPRITAVGRFLRRTSLDELPQLWNVVQGGMSLVGPRPPLPGEVEKYEDNHYGRFDMKPGITGPWQVSGRNDITSFDEIIALDTEYLAGWSLMRDVKILFKTIPAVLSQRGAV